MSVPGKLLWSFNLLGIFDFYQARNARNEYAVSRQDRKSTHLGFMFLGFVWAPVAK